jgi:hypothetical protein
MTKNYSIYMTATKLSLALMAVILPITFSFSQSSGGQQSVQGAADESELLEINGANWTFYLDKEDKKCYIDFETISVNLTEIEVKTTEGKLILRENLSDLPVDAIYELDMKEWDPGKYQVELKTYTGVIRRELEVESTP